MNESEETEDIYCKKCKKDVEDNDPGLFCEGKCQSWYHSACVGVSQQQYKKISSDIKDIILWMCVGCRKNLQQLMTSAKTMEKMEKLVEQVCGIEQKIGTIYSKMDTGLMSYARAVGETNVPKKANTNLPSVIIQPKHRQDSKKTAKDLERAISPDKIGLRIKNKKELPNGKLIIKCPAQSDIDTLKTTAKEFLGRNYDIIETNLKKPRIKIPGVSTNRSDYGEIEQVIKGQNPIISNEDEFKVVHIKTFKTKNTKTLIVECSPRLFHTLMANQKLYFGWERYTIFEDISVLKCYNCHQFKHKSGECKNSKLCYKCSSDQHEGENCDAHSGKCVNCQLSNANYTTKYDVDHQPNDPSCPSYKYQLEVAKSRINYG